MAGDATGGRTGAGGVEDSGAVIVVDADATGVGLGCGGSLKSTEENELMGSNL